MLVAAPLPPKAIPADDEQRRCRPRDCCVRSLCVALLDRPAAAPHRARIAARHRRALTSAGAAQAKRAVASGIAAGRISVVSTRIIICWPIRPLRYLMLRAARAYLPIFIIVIFL